MNKILQYLKTSTRRGLLFKKNERLEMEVYIDPNYAGPVTNRKSFTRCCMFLGKNLMTWISKKQNVIAGSVRNKMLLQGLVQRMNSKL